MDLRELNAGESELNSRSYQLEMFERSKERNVVIVMDTGSGKTHVAVRRIQYELDICAQKKRVWFLAPTVELCMQQHSSLSAALPSYTTRLLTGSDNVDHWSEQRIWDSALDQVRIVVSTHAVLAQALQHGFVSMSELALIVFDEAHHCVNKHPANEIMRDFYHPIKLKNGSGSVPNIIGLSATLVTKSNAQTLRLIEQNLDSTSITPRIHREDLLLHVHRPICRYLEANASTRPLLACENLNKLKAIHENLDLAYNIRRTTVLDEHSTGLSGLLSVEELKATKKALRKFCDKTEHLLNNLGTWAAEYYIQETIRLLEKKTNCHADIFFELHQTHQRALLALFDRHDLQYDLPEQLLPFDHNVSPKVRCLISFLLEENEDAVTGIVFVEQRVTTTVLSTLLMLHPDTRDRFRSVPFVGTSNASSRKFGLAELVDLKAQREALSKFHDGRANIVVATNALEEGIDVQSCNIVTCFDSPANLKSFVQRRGRARHIRSRLGIIVSTDLDRAKIRKFEALERELTAVFQSDRQQAEIMDELENDLEYMDYELSVPSTGAKLTADTTLQHLYHFCSQLPHQVYVDVRPIFSYDEDADGLIEATVSMPNSLNATLRRATSKRRWKTERAAKKDAAFQAYAALYNAGLLNENLLPLYHEWHEWQSSDEGHQGESETGQVDILPQYDVWSRHRSDGEITDWFEIKVTVLPPSELRNIGETSIELILTTRRQLPPVREQTLVWASGVLYQVIFGPAMVIAPPSKRDLELSRSAMSLLYTSVRSEKAVQSNMSYAAQLRPRTEDNDLASWLDKHSRSTIATALSGQTPCSLLRVPFSHRPVFVFHDWAMDNGEPMVQCERLPKRKNFSIEISDPTEETDKRLVKRLHTFPAKDCTFDSLPYPFAKIGLFMPAIFQHIEDSTIASALQSDLLSSVPFRDEKNLITAICAPSAVRQTNYQRFEFIGDSILKFIISWRLFTSQPNWHEGFLSLKRSHLVSNSALARAAIGRGVSRYIITEAVSYKDWVPPLVDKDSSSQNGRRVSYKLLADVVEALIGAAYLDSGLDAAILCIDLLLPVITSPAPADEMEIIQHENPVFSQAAEFESLVGYRFRDHRLLLEALTHPSCGSHSYTESYQRLEYLGDAVLDMLIAKRLAAHVDHLSQGSMTRMKAALVNAHLLGFLCLNLRRSVEHRDVETPTNSLVTHETTTTREVHLATYMRFFSFAMADACKLCQQRYSQYADTINQKLTSGDAYPWVGLLQLRPEKVYSDLVESVIGAIFLDSGNDLDMCEAFIDKLGLSAYVTRLLAEDVDVFHPKDRLQQLAGSKAVRYDVQRNGESGKYCCYVFVEDRMLEFVEDCDDGEQALVMAASNAAKMTSRQ